MSHSTAMKRILFVDDEPSILDGLRRMLHNDRQRWAMTWVTSGEAALAELEKAPFDVIVTDHRMPGMDGASLLARVQKRFPQVARIVLSGHAELETALLALPVTHQFLSKPCDAALFHETIERATLVETLLADPQLRRVVGGMKELPSLPRTYAALSRALAAPDAPVREIASIIEQDLGMSVKILHAASSGFFGRSRRPVSVQAAVLTLGTSLLRNIVLSIDVFRTFESAAGAQLEALQEHALLTASVAARLLPEKPLAEQAYLAGLLHDVGRLVLAARLPGRLATCEAAARAEGRPLYDVEASLDGVTHAEIGAYLLALWGLPYPIVEAVALHHRPQRAGRNSFDILGAVHVADALASEHAAAAGAAGAGDGELDLAYLESLGLADRVASWRELALEEAVAQPAA